MMAVVGLPVCVQVDGSSRCSLEPLGLQGQHLWRLWKALDAGRRTQMQPTEVTRVGLQVVGATVRQDFRAARASNERRRTHHERGLLRGHMVPGLRDPNLLIYSCALHEFRLGPPWLHQMEGKRGTCCGFRCIPVNSLRPN